MSALPRCSGLLTQGPPSLLPWPKQHHVSPTSRLNGSSLVRPTVVMRVPAPRGSGWQELGRLQLQPSTHQEDRHSTTKSMATQKPLWVSRKLQGGSSAGLSAPSGRSSTAECGTRRLCDGAGGAVRCPPGGLAASPATYWTPEPSPQQGQPEVSPHITERPPGPNPALRVRTAGSEPCADINGHGKVVLLSSRGGRDPQTS